MQLVKVMIAAIVALLASGSLASAANYDVRFRLNNSGTYDSLQFDVNYSAANGDFIGTGASVTCTANSALSIMAAFNDVGTKLTQGIIASTGVTGAVQLANCTFSGPTAPSPSSFVVSVTDWSSSVGSGTPSVSVSSVVLIP